VHSVEQLRIAVWIGDARDTDPKGTSTGCGANWLAAIQAVETRLVINIRFEAPGLRGL
jgi:hypothetical protein